MAQNSTADSPDIEPVVVCKHVNVFYGDKQAINDISLDIQPKTITSFIGPSGCGKSTFLRTLNRMNDTIDGCRVEGEILIDNTNIYHPDIDVVPLRARVGMVFQKPNPFPKSIFDNVAYGPKIHGLAKTNAELADIVERALHGSGLWDEVKDRLDQPGTGLSGGQQQRLCIARTIAVAPEIILMDEPCSWNLPQKLKLMVGKTPISTHSMQQAARFQKTVFSSVTGYVMAFKPGQQQARLHHGRTMEQHGK